MKPTHKPMRGHTAAQANQTSLAAKTATVNQIIQEGPFDHAERTLTRTRELCARILGLGERLVSHYAPDDSAAVPSPANVFASLDCACSDADYMLSKANSALDAIESALP